eukprot:12574297-Alexandrium_andersonii.AAC.1
MDVQALRDQASQRPVHDMPLLRGAAPREHPGEGSPQQAVLGTAQEAALRRRGLGEESQPGQGSESSGTAGEGVRG